MLKRHALLDGGTMTLEAGEHVDLWAPATSSWVASIGSHQQEFTSGVRDFGESDARVTSGVELNESYGFAGGRLRTGTRSFFDRDLSVNVGVRVGVWEGERASISTHLYREGGPPATTDIISLFEAFELAEGEGDGAASMHPRPTSRADSAEPAILVKDLPGIGLTSTKQLDKAEVRSIPAWSGTPVAGGELFVNRAGTSREHFLLVGNTTITTIVPAEFPLGNAALDQLASLVVTIEP